MNQHKSLLEYFYEWEAKIPEQVYLRQPKGSVWHEYTWKEVGKLARKIASFIQNQNLAAKSHIAIISKNCYHWIISDLAIMMSGHISVPLYANTPAEELSYVIEHSDCKMAFIGKLDEWDSRKNSIPKNVTTIAYPQYEGNAIIEADYYWDTLIKTNEPIANKYIPALNDLFTILYTSGTTGKPKGVMHTWNATAALFESQIEEDDLKLNGGEVRLFSYLPLNHIAERIFIEAVSMFKGATISFAESIDTFANNLASVKPTHFIAVPRIWTKFQIAIIEKLGEKRLNNMLRLPLLKNVIKSTIQKRLGLSKARLMLTGAAPMPDGTLQWYKKFDINIQEVYGMTENNGGCTLMPKEAIKSGTVGKPIHGVELKINSESGEILTKAPWLMTGYYKNKDKSNEVLKDGWLHTGDLGEIDNQGYLKITGRLNDNFKSAKGKFIVPSPLEYHFAVNTDIELVCVTGSNLPQPIALCVLSEIGQKKDKKDLQNSIEQNLYDTNNGLPNYTKLKKVVVLNDLWTLENGLLTPTLKIKRNVLFNRYKDQLPNWYESEKSIVFV